MKVYFGGSVSGKKLYLNNYIKIVETLKSLGHEVLLEDLFETTEDLVLKQTTEQKIKIHETLGKMKLESDIIVIEASYRSFAVGQEIAYSFRIGKPVLALHTKDNIPHFILTDAADRLLVSEYNLSNLKSKIIEGFAYLDPKSFKRFTLNLPANIIDHLDGVALNSKLSRSEYIRDLIQDDIKNKSSNN